MKKPKSDDSAKAHAVKVPSVERPFSHAADPGALRHLFSVWEPERPELLVRLRPRGANDWRGRVGTDCPICRSGSDVVRGCMAPRPVPRMWMKA